MNACPSFQSHQVVYLEHEGEKLYAEVIQVVPDRGLCWARPLALVRLTNLTPLSEIMVEKDPETTWNFHDLRQASDILLPISFFQLALDVEVLPLLTKIYSDGDLTLIPDNALSNGSGFECDRPAQQELIQFFRKICQAYPDRFQYPC